jgi:hypothetical protein
VFCEVWIEPTNIISIILERPEIHVTLKKKRDSLSSYISRDMTKFVGLCSLLPQAECIFGEPLTNNTPGAIITVVDFRLSSGDRMKNEQTKDTARENIVRIILLIE